MTMARSTPEPSSFMPQTKAAIVSKPAINRRAQEEYRRVQIETASPTRLVVMLYDGAIRFCTLGLEAMREHNFEAQNTYLIRVQKIIGEFMSALNQKEGGDVAENLARVYAFMLEQLVSANLYDRPKPVETVLTMLRDLREGWVAIDSGSAQTTLAVAAAPPAKPDVAPTPLMAAAALSAVRQPLPQRAPIKSALMPPPPTGPQVSRLGDRSA